MVLTTFESPDTAILAFVHRDSRPNCSVECELRRNGPRSQSRKESPLGPPFRVDSSPVE